MNEGIIVAKATGATLHLLYVVETGSLGSDARSVLKEGDLTERANTIMSDATESAEAESLDAVESNIEYGSPVKEIRTFIQENDIDLAILGTHGETNFSCYTIGVSAKIVRTSPIPVMWIRKPESGE